MNETTRITIENVKAHLKKDLHSFVCQLCEAENGFLCQIRLDTRTYFEKIVVNEQAQLICMEIYPGIHCEDLQRAHMTNFINDINEAQLCGAVRLRKNGDVYYQITQAIMDSPVSVDSVEWMEFILLQMTYDYEVELELVAHGEHLVGPEEVQELWNEMIEE